MGQVIKWRWETGIIVSSQQMKWDFCLQTAWLTKQLAM
jgi:hypothetical protein